MMNVVGVVASVGGTFATIFFVVIVVVIVGVVASTKQKVRQEGAKQIVCPHCGTRGFVTVKAAQVKRGVSGGKATGAVLTGGVSLLETGLSRKQSVTRAHCGNCKMSWIVE